MLEPDKSNTQLHARVANKFKLLVDPSFFTYEDIQND